MVRGRDHFSPRRVQTRLPAGERLEIKKLLYASIELETNETVGGCVDDDGSSLAP